jgi:hypothetical protein
MNRKLKLLGLALGVTALLALGLGGAVMAADGRDRGANCEDCLEGTLPEGVDCPRLDADGTAEAGACYRWGEDADRPCLNEDGVCTEEDCPRLDADGAAEAGACYRWGEDAERPCLNEDGECDGTGCLANEGEVTGAGNCWRGEQAERSCLDETGENVAAFAGSGCMRGGR